MIFPELLRRILAGDSLNDWVLIRLVSGLAEARTAYSFVHQDALLGIRSCRKHHHRQLCTGLEGSCARQPRLWRKFSTCWIMCEEDEQLNKRGSDKEEQHSVVTDSIHHRVHADDI